MNAKDILELAQMLDQAEQFRPAIRAIIDKAHTFGPEIKSAIVPMLKGMAEIRVDVFNHYIALGMSREEALAMTVADIQAPRTSRRPVNEPRHHEAVLDGLRALERSHKQDA